MLHEKTHSDDDRLVARLKQKDKTALDDLLRAHGGKLYGVAIQFMRNEHDAQDVLQDALVTIWNKIATFEGRSAFTSWLYRVTANTALMALRKKKRHESDVSMDAAPGARGQAFGLSGDPAEQPDVTIARGELGKEVLSAIDQLDEPYRTAVLLKDVEEFSISEIAKMTDSTDAAVKSRLHRGRLALREALLPYLKGEEEGQS